MFVFASIGRSGRERGPGKKYFSLSPPALSTHSLYLGPKMGKWQRPRFRMVRDNPVVLAVLVLAIGLFLLFARVPLSFRMHLLIRWNNSWNMEHIKEKLILVKSGKASSELWRRKKGDLHAEIEWNMDRKCRMKSKTELTWHDEHISVLVAVIRSVSGGAVAYWKPWCLIRDELKNERRSFS